jgi:hypothetical protein
MTLKPLLGFLKYMHVVETINFKNFRESHGSCHIDLGFLGVYTNITRRLDVLLGFE